MAKRQITPKHPKLPNGFGRITKIKGNLRKPFRAMVTIGKDFYGTPIGKSIGYYETWYDAYDALLEYHKNPYELNSTITIAALYEKWSESYFQDLSSDSSERTILSAWNYVTPEFQRLTATSIRPQALKDYITHDAYRIDQKGKKLYPTPNLQSRMKSMFNLMFDYAVMSGLMDNNPARLFSLQKVRSLATQQRKTKIPFSREDEKALWEDIDYGYTRMILINIYSGWRPQEMVYLQKRNIDLEKMTMTGGMKTAAGTNRVVPIHPKIQDLVLYYYNRSDSIYLFRDYDQIQPTTLTYEKYRHRFDKVMLRHGWTQYSTSCPRHTFATRATEAEMTELSIKMIMGHVIDDVTQKHYIHLDWTDYMKKEMEKLQ